MKSENTYERSVSLASGLEVCVRESGDIPVFLNVRRELNHFLLNLNLSHRADCAGQQIHFLFLALESLDRVEKEIHAFGQDQDAVRMERVRLRIRNLKNLILDYIKLLGSGI